MASAKILVVDDEKLIRWSVRQRLETDGFAVSEAEDGASAMRALAAGVDLVVLDVRLPDINGVQLLAQMKAADPDVIAIMMTGDASVETAVDSMKQGAFHYCAKPVNLDELAIFIRNALETTRLRRELKALRSAQTDESSAVTIVGESEAIERVKKLLVKVAQSPASTVLITGETGTGKDLAARYVHFHSDRAAAPFMNITCTTLPDALFESEIFGHEKGAFTGATHQRKGLLEQADGGTVFLDEIGELPAPLQAKLLRFLEDKTLRRVGGAVDIRVDVRVIAATNRDLSEMVKGNQFREDLYYRLQVLPVELPALRERRGDIEILAKFFANIFSQRFRKSIARIDADAMAALRAYHWPGNVRELRNAVERAALLCDADYLTHADFPAIGRAAAEPVVNGFRLPPEGVNLDELERDLVTQAMERTNNNQTRAAALLGLNRDQIRYRIQKFGLDGAANSKSSAD